MFSAQIQRQTRDNESTFESYVNKIQYLYNTQEKKLGQALIERS